MVDLIDLCNTKSELPLTPEEMRALLDETTPTAIPVASKPAHQISQRLGQEGCDEITRRYESGETAEALADEFGVAKSALLNLLRSRNVVVRRRALTQLQVNVLSRAYQSGKTIAELEHDSGIPHGSIQRALKAAGVVMRPRGRSQRRWGPTADGL